MAKIDPKHPAGSEPFCNNCGYVLTGLIESSKCPECGRPIVEVLMRPTFDKRRMKSVRYRSNATLWGLPLVSVATGPGDDGPIGKARGIIAVGDVAIGVVAVGGQAFGLIAIGGVAAGVIALGGVAGGALAIGGAAIGILAMGGAAIGVFAIGGAALGVIHAVGAAAVRIPLPF